MREIPLKCSRFLGKCTAHPEYGRLFPLVYISMAFFIIPGIAYGIASA
jgi:sodium-dependent phosphate cotransporter